MSLTPGTKLGPYEVIGPLGAGGMGEVFRARDTRLGRDVAIKALPDEFALDPERLARFEREARLLASLSHPNVAGIHGLELVEGHRYLILEFVEGETLQARLSRGPLSVAETVDVAKQIAAGVEAAHEAGVVHRDLKPGNVMLRSDGTVKVLDFGLAKGGAAHGGSSADHGLSASPTMTYAATGAGVILGTAAYMSPEQARGRAADRRTDVWSFGCVLFECLSTRRVFDGETVSDMVARILEREPDWSALPAATPVWLVALLKRCLTKDLKLRLQAIGEARIALERMDDGVAAVPAAVAPRVPAWRRALPWAVAAVLAALLVVRMLLPGAGAGLGEERRVELSFPPGQHRDVWSMLSLSPDGRRAVVVATDSSGTSRAWVRSLDQFAYRPLKGTEGTELVFWSPDSRSIGFVSRGTLNRISVDDGTISVIAKDIQTQRGGSWGENGSILYTPSANSSIWSVPATGGTPVQVTKLDTTLVDASHRFPVWLPDGKHFLYAMWSNNPRVSSEAGGIYVASIDGGAPRRVTPDVGSFVLLRSGYLLVKREANIVAVPFDLRSCRAGTQSITVADDVGFMVNGGLLLASASTNSDIAFSGQDNLPPADMAWLDRAGHRADPIGLRSQFGAVQLSPDESRVVGLIQDATGLSQLWTADLIRGTVSRLTRGANDSFRPAWSPDGQQIAFNNNDSGTDDIYVQLATGTRDKVRHWIGRDVDAEVTSWSADGRLVFFDGSPRAGSRHSQVWVLDLASDSAHAVLEGDFDQGGAQLSPDGRYLAYVSDESGRYEIFVRSFPDLERKWQVSTAGGVRPHWRKDGRELIYLSPGSADQAVMSASIAPAGADLAVGEPQRLFVVPSDLLDLSPSSDHSRFLALIQPAALEQAPMRLVLGWKPKRSNVR